MNRVAFFVALLSVCPAIMPRAGHAQDSEQRGRKIIERMNPVYPDLARRTHLTGVVKPEVAVRADGSVKSARAVGGNPVLIDSATNAIRQWRFERAGEETTEVIQISFKPM
jgi:TonB family protein